MFGGEKVMEIERFFLTAQVMHGQFYSFLFAVM